MRVLNVARSPHAQVETVRSTRLLANIGSMQRYPGAVAAPAEWLRTVSRS